MKFKIQVYTIIDGWIDDEHDPDTDELITYDTFKEALDSLRKYLLNMEEAGIDDIDECDYRVTPADYYDDPSQNLGQISNPG